MNTRRKPPTEEQQRLLERIHVMLGEEIADSKIGFALLCFDFAEDGFMTWCSNHARKEMIELLREVIERLEADSVATGIDPSTRRPSR